MAQAPSNLNVGVTTYPSNADNGNDIWEDSGITAPVYRPIIVTSATTVNVAAGSTGLKFRVLELYLSNTPPCTVAFQDGVPVTLAPYIMATVQPINLPYNKMGYFESSVGAPLNISVAGTSPVVSGHVIGVYH